MGLLEPILKHAFPIKSIGFYDATSRRAQIRFHQSDDETGCMAVLPQCLPEDLFEAALAEDDTQVSWRHEVTSLASGVDCVTATINKFERESSTESHDTREYESHNMKFGYARVSTDAQETHRQMDALSRAKCTRIYRRKASGAKTRLQLSSAPNCGNE